ncbi:DNA-binding protein [Pseudomonas chengduensis]|nr:DNA-binding protein [Pseudomonas chengduensis]MDH0959368.1 DNA-binding protein [Pseudomonas chengduensis]
MELSGVGGLSISGDAQRVTDFRDAPFCTKYVLAQLLGMEQITEDVVRGWIESHNLPTCSHRVINTNSTLGIGLLA